MHGEAFAWSRAALARPAPAGLEAQPVLSGGAPLRIEGGEIVLGRAAAAPGFSFDNELPGRALRLAPFEIDAAPLTQGAFLRFVEAGGYENAVLLAGRRRRVAARPVGRAIRSAGAAPRAAAGRRAGSTAGCRSPPTRR